ncbi:MAG TPA: ABC transporter substrate-binding protein [Polyangiaceae bacterium]|nr:ABC transporter substrate-binding protein [Polyangiaceae bacterium]
MSPNWDDRCAAQGRTWAQRALVPCLLLAGLACRSDARAGSEARAAANAGTNAAPVPAAAKGVPAAREYGEPGEPVHLVVGYQPYYAEAWSGVIVNGLGLWKKHLPEGSSVEFQIGLQGSVIVNAMLAGKQQIGYLGDTPAIVAATKREVADLRIVAHIGAGQDQCNVFFVRNDAPQFASAHDAIRWLDGKTVAVPKGSCTDRFARAVFAKEKISPKEYLNQSVELITSGFRAHKLDAAVIWEPTASRLVADGLARRVATGKDVGESDGAFIDMRADLIEQRPDVVTGWLRAELEAETYLANPENSREVARLAKAHTTGFDEAVLWDAVYGRRAAGGAADVRLALPFGFTEQSLDHLRAATSFLYEVKSIDVPQLPGDAIITRFTDEILRERGLTKPVGEVLAQDTGAER